MIIKVNNYLLLNLIKKTKNPFYFSKMDFLN